MPRHSELLGWLTEQPRYLQRQERGLSARTGNRPGMKNRWAYLGFSRKVDVLSPGQVALTSLLPHHAEAASCHVP
jgi:hypothetical protein